MKLHLKPLIISAAFGLSLSSCDGCFVGETLVDTPDGPRRIDSLRKGDVVWAWNVAQGERVRRSIVATHRTEAQVVCRVQVGDRVIPGVTPEHPFFHVSASAFVAFRDLPTDALLLTIADGEATRERISSLQITEHPAPCVTVFNLSVGGDEQTFFAEGVLVHNKQPIPDWDISDGARSTSGWDGAVYDGGMTGDTGPVCPVDASCPDSDGSEGGGGG